MKDITSKAAELIKQGELVAFPTETVYGLGADATNSLAVKKIFDSKGRPSHNPLIVHVSSVVQAMEIAHFNELAQRLTKLWPGPLTMVLPKRKNYQLSPEVTAGLNTVAIRIPAHKTAQKLIAKSCVPIAAPSANKSGFLSSTSYEHVNTNFSNIFTIEDQSKAEYGLESTIIDLTNEQPTILRFGFITPEIIEDILGIRVLIADKKSDVKAPGMLLKHYSPNTKIRLNAYALKPGEVGLNYGASNLTNEDSLNLSEDGDLAEAASNLFDFLHKLDKIAQEKGCLCIAVASIPNEGIGLAINDRLKRAAE